MPTSLAHKMLSSSSPRVTERRAHPYSLLSSTQQTRVLLPRLCVDIPEFSPQFPIFSSALATCIGLCVPQGCTGYGEAHCNADPTCQPIYQLQCTPYGGGGGLAPDCGLSPGLASVLAGDLVRRLRTEKGPRRTAAPAKKKADKPAIDALKLYVGGLPKKPRPPFEYQLVFSVEGLINEYVEPARVLKGGKLVEIEPLTEPEEFHIRGFRPMVAFHTSGGTSTMPESFQGEVGECFEKTLRYPDHYTLIRGLHDLGFFSSEKRRLKSGEISPRELTSHLFLEKLSGEEPDVTIMRIEAHANKRVLSYTMLDEYDRRTNLTSMMRTTAWSASVVLQMMAAGAIAKRGGIRQELDVPTDLFLREMSRRGVKIRFAQTGR